MINWYPLKAGFLLTNYTSALQCTYWSLLFCNIFWVNQTSCQDNQKVRHGCLKDNQKKKEFLKIWPRFLEEAVASLSSCSKAFVSCFATVYCPEILAAWVSFLILLTRLRIMHIDPSSTFKLCLTLMSIQFNQTPAIG